MAYFGLLDKGMFVHHFMCVIGMSTCLYENISANYLVAGLFISEISNPIMHVRMVLKHLGLRYTKSYEVSEFSYIMLYTFGRIFIGTSVMIKTLTC